MGSHPYMETINEKSPCFNEIELPSDHPFWARSYSRPITRELAEDIAAKFAVKANLVPYGASGLFNLYFPAIYIVADRKKSGQKWREIGRVEGTCKADAMDNAEKFFGVDTVFILKDWQSLKLKV